MKTKTPRILLDHQIFTLQTFGGISRVFSEIYKRFKTGDLIDLEVPILFSENEYIKDELRLMTLYKGKTFFLKTLIYYIFNRLYSTFRLIITDFDIFQPTYYDPYFIPFLKGKPFVLFIYDMTHEMFPESVSKKDKTIQWKKKLVQKAHKIIAISENTKKDIVKFYDINPTKVEVVYLATSLHLPKGNNEIKLPERYILYVGKRELYKNFELFFEAITPLLKEDKDLSLICAGSSNFSEEDKKLFRKLGLEERIKHIRFKNDKELSYIYSKALCFVFPSLYEGFGIPVLEAFACECPVVLSNSSSLPEVGGDAVEYVNPQDKTSMRNGVQKVIYNQELRNILIKNGKDRSKMFSWDKSTNRIFEIYKSCLENLD